MAQVLALLNDPNLTQPRSRAGSHTPETGAAGADPGARGVGARAGMRRWTNTYA